MSQRKSFANSATALEMLMFLLVVALPSRPPPPASIRCPALTHYSPVCFVPCLADGPEISPEQEEGTYPHSFVSSFEPSLGSTLRPSVRFCCSHFFLAPDRLW